MPCSVAVANSPVFSPSPRVSSIFRKPSLSSPVNPSSSSTSSSPISPLSPVTLCLHKQLSGYDREFEKEEQVCSTSTPMTLFKKKRPASITIPIASLSSNLAAETPRDVDRVKDVEVEGEGYSVYCKRGKRGAMEDRYSAVVGLQGDSAQVKL
ncbi:unnamed protein product [Ilex paraguariensis]|uniref:Uncharacterized protein n=1 Tax=Ilex paraguariensis TaxID=185542 RepID=A0ABC8QST4_9AQUA